MLCSMCPSVRLSDKHAPGHGWQCPACIREINCAHCLTCSACGANRYAMEKAGRLKDGRPVPRCTLDHAAMRAECLSKGVSAECPECSEQFPAYREEDRNHGEDR